MPAVTTSAVAKVEVAETRQERKLRAARVVGLAIASVVPAVFWTLLIKVAAAWYGSPLTSATLAITCGAITLFLVIVCAPLMIRN